MAQVQQQGMSTPMALLITTLAGFVMLLIYIMVLPVIGGTVESTMPEPSEICSYGDSGGHNLVYHRCNGTGNVTTGSSWNSTYNTALPKASDIYTNNMPIIAACIAFIFLGLLFFFLRGMIL